MSYSLYLWHWPIFAFVDYRLYLGPAWRRFALKVALTAVMTSLSYFVIERPGRIFLNVPHRRRLAFGVMLGMILLCASLGTAVKKTNYLDATGTDVLNGGISLNASGTSGSIVLMGDSYGSMYGKMVGEIARSRGLRLNVISKLGSTPIPLVSGVEPELWLESLAFVKRVKPDIIVLACHWVWKMDRQTGNVEIAVNELKKHTRLLILITQPPQLPASGLRASMRAGSRPPFREDEAVLSLRKWLNEFIKTLQRDNEVVIDVEPRFIGNDGSVRFKDEDDHLLYFDSDHLSSTGVDLVRGDLVGAIDQLK